MRWDWIFLPLVLFSGWSDAEAYAQDGPAYRPLPEVATEGIEQLGVYWIQEVSKTLKDSGNPTEKLCSEPAEGRPPARECGRPVWILRSGTQLIALDARAQNRESPSFSSRFFRTADPPEGEPDRVTCKRWVNVLRKPLFESQLCRAAQLVSDPNLPGDLQERLETTDLFYSYSGMNPLENPQFDPQNLDGDGEYDFQEAALVVFTLMGTSSFFEVEVPKLPQGTLPPQLTVREITEMTGLLLFIPFSETYEYETLLVNQRPPTN